MIKDTKLNINYFDYNDNDNDNDNEIVYFDINNKTKNIEQKQLLE